MCCAYRYAAVCGSPKNNTVWLHSYQGDNENNSRCEHGVQMIDSVQETMLLSNTFEYSATVPYPPAKIEC